MISDELRERKNTHCLTKCKKDRRGEIAEEGICDIAPSVLDGLKTRCVGGWAYEKIHYLMRYFSIFSQGMYKKWPGLNYIEICSGPGRCIRRSDGIEFDGTSLAIINSDKLSFIRSAVFIDNNDDVVDTLRKRIASSGKSNVAQAHQGNYKSCDMFSIIQNNVSNRCLNLAFIDPTDCSVPFSTIKRLKGILRKIDLIINVAIGTDVTRNIVNAIIDPGFTIVREKYSSFLGNDSFFSEPRIREMAYSGDSEKLKGEFLLAYQQSLRNIGYKFIEYDIKIKNYYNLLFATEHERGIDFWKKASIVEPTGQLKFDM